MLKKLGTSLATLVAAATPYVANSADVGVDWDMPFGEKIENIKGFNLIIEELGKEINKIYLPLKSCGVTNNIGSFTLTNLKESIAYRASIETVDKRGVTSDPTNPMFFYTGKRNSTNDNSPPYFAITNLQSYESHTRSLTLEGELYDASDTALNFSGDIDIISDVTIKTNSRPWQWRVSFYTRKQNGESVVYGQAIDKRGNVTSLRTKVYTSFQYETRPAPFSIPNLSVSQNLMFENPELFKVIREFDRFSTSFTNSLLLEDTNSPPKK